MNLEEIKAKYPQYAQIPNGELAYRLWNKSYKGKLPMGVFADQIGLSGDDFGQMIGTAKQSGYNPTDQTYTTGEIPKQSRLRSLVQGVTFGFGDELAGLSYGLGRKAGGAKEPLAQLAKEGTQLERGALQQYQAEKPVESAAMEMAGGLLSPANIAGAPAAVTPANPMLRAGLAGAVSGAAYGAGAGEGGIKQRAENAAEVAIPSALFGSASQGVLQLVGRGGVRVARAFDRSLQAPTLDNLREAKTIAYRVADQSGTAFNKSDMTQLFVDADDIARSLNYVPEVDTQTAASLKVLENYADKDVSLGQLDKLRQSLWTRYNASKGSEPAIAGMIDKIDELIASVPATNDLMTAARLANSRYKKAELLQNAFEKAELQTAATGSGGNILNKYKQAVTSIITNPKQAKWFNDQELSAMDDFIRGGFGQNALRLMGKLSPSGNGLMLALNIGAIAADPSMALATAVGAGSKALSDTSGAAGAQRLIEQVSTGRAPYRFPYLPTAGVSGAAGSNIQERVGSDRTNGG